MSILQAFVLGLVQGATEFIPISSSGHLTLVPWLLSWHFAPVLKGAFDALTHWGTLVAVLAFFRRDLWNLLCGALRTLGGLRDGWRGVMARCQADAQGRLAWRIVLGSVPAAVLGLLWEDFFEMLFGTPPAVSVLLWVTAGLLAFSEWNGQQGRALASLTWLDALLIGVGQGLAIAPGISRSGATIAFGLMRGVRREAAARYSFLLSVPVVAGAGVWQLRDLLEDPRWTAHLAPMLAGLLVSALVGYVCIRFLLRYLQRGKLYVFSIYCALAGMVCLIVWVAR
jgi:undecaprenyl-diphosphatase